MVDFLVGVTTSFIINLITNLAWDKKIKRDEKKVIQDIQLKISDFNRRYDNTELDTYAFQKFIETSEVSNIIYNRVFTAHTVDSEPIEDFKFRMAKYAIEEVNQYYEKMERSKIHNEDVFYEYFTNLIDTLINVRSQLLSLESSMQTAIIVDEIRGTKDELKEAMVEQFEKLREENIFADDKINQIKKMIDMFKLDEAEKELSEVLESQHLLSKPQREEVYYQKARISIITDNYEKINDIKEKIDRINKNSKFITEINYHIACNKQDRELLNTVISGFHELKYSREEILLKEINFEINVGNLHSAMELLTVNGEIKKELSEYHKAHFYYGNILIRNGKYQRAFQEFSKAFEMFRNIIYKYNELIARQYIIIEDEKNLVESSQKFIEDARNTINEFKEIQYITEFFRDTELIGFWTFIINLTIIVNPKDALKEIEKIKDSIKGNETIITLFANVYYFNGMKEEAKKFLLKVWDYMPENTLKLFSIFDYEKDWDSIINRYNSLSSYEFVTNPRILVLNLKANYKVNGYVTINNDIIPTIEKYPYDGLILKESLNIILENNDNEKFQAVINIIENNKSSYLNTDLKYISEVLFNFQKYNEIRRLLYDRIEYNEELLEMYIMSFGELNQASEVTREAYGLIKNLYDKNVRFKTLLTFKIHIEMVMDNWRKAIETLIEYKALYGLDNYYAYHMVISKIQKNDYDNLEEETSCLLATEEPSFHFLAASLKANQEKWEEAQRIAFGALYLSHENLTKEILMSYISLHFANIEKESKEVNFKQVINNSVVFLKKNGLNRTIAIHQNKDIIKKSGEYKFGCENYHHDDVISLILISEGNAGEEVELLDGKYEVVEILNIYTYFFRICLEKLESEYPEHGYFVSKSAETPEESIEQMKETLKIVNEDRNKQLEMYNFGVQTGLPISYLSGKSVDSYAEIIISLLNHKTQHLYAGEISIVEDSKYVLSLSSLILMAIFGLVDKLENISEKCFISPEIIKCIEVGMKESQKHSVVGAGVVILNEDNQISAYTYTDEDKKARRKFWSSIRIALSKIVVEEVIIDDIDMYDLLSKSILDADIESIELSKKTDRVFVCDDFFIRRLHHGITNGANTTNFIGFIMSEGLVTYEELIDIILKLVKAKYLYSINSDVILEYCKLILSIKDEKERVAYFEKLKEVYKYIFSQDSARYYGKIHDEFVRAAISTGINSLLIYDLVREPFKLKPIHEFIKEKSQEFIQQMFEL